MSACPFCFEEMKEAFSQGLLREECEACGALWLSGEMVEKIVGHTVSDLMLREARGKPGECQGCHGPLQYVPNCPGCGRDCPTCPGCRASPLPAAELCGVKVDVCVPCRGIALAGADLPRLVVAARRDRPLELDLKPPVQQAPGAPMACTQCARKLKPEHAFAWDRKLYCGSCAPSEAAPYDVELTRADPSATIDASPYMGYATKLERAEDSAARGLTWLFSKLLG
ncbi:zf-TFIIB domain-containing protein [Myxococcaceae bacterium GXIMD 01537]